MKYGLRSQGPISRTLFVKTYLQAEISVREKERGYVIIRGFLAVAKQSANRKAPTKSLCSILNGGIGRGNASIVVLRVSDRPQNG
jgi:hypothetical protein